VQASLTSIFNFSLQHVLTITIVLFVILMKQCPWFSSSTCHYLKYYKRHELNFYVEEGEKNNELTRIKLTVRCENLRILLVAFLWLNKFLS